jgi:hypothetical protein
MPSSPSKSGPFRSAAGRVPRDLAPTSEVRPAAGGRITDSRVPRPRGPKFPQGTSRTDHAKHVAHRVERGLTVGPPPPARRIVVD